ncbi:MAG: hypothetical protein ACRC13_05720 [Tannerellaceae bacterium]
MGFFKKLFGRKQIEVDASSPMNKEDFVDESEPEEINADSSFNVGNTIDVIFAFLKVDYESKGYEDALTNPDISYREMNKKIIRSKLEILFNEVRSNYDDKLRLIDFHIDSRRNAGLVDIVTQLMTRKEQLLDHQSKLNEMEQHLKQNEPYMVSMLMSYEKGFTKGLAALSVEHLKSL